MGGTPHNLLHITILHLALPCPMLSAEPQIKQRQRHVQPFQCSVACMSCSCSQLTTFTQLRAAHAASTRSNSWSTRAISLTLSAALSTA